MMHILSRRNSSARGRLIALALFVCMLAAPLSAPAEEAGLTLPEPWPEVIDRVNMPDAYPDFAFAQGETLLEAVNPSLQDCDALLLRCGGETMLVDCATYAQSPRVVEMLRAMNVERLDYVLISHPHHDHTEGFELIASTFEVGTLMLCFPPDENAHMKKLLLVAAEKGIDVSYFHSGDGMTLGEARISFWQLEDASAGVNSRSAQLKATLGHRSILLTGDIEPDGARAMLSSVEPGWMRTDILKYPHHGVSSMPEGYLDAVRPGFIFMTAVVKERYGKRAVAASGIPWCYTNKDLLCMSTNGSTWLVERRPVSVDELQR